ncbi:hypothetical protein NUV26_32410, partial [Burkholderia pseudomultivorans]|uniref:hypothetical protein n=1 Tax=Burkholderia pseudomultivorans TaxID=1207504 RepID=UPI0012DA23C9|nr:hypothetical protein [Burkholderia pseudomultivorans]MDS0796870.1 hypothetical protein [Burkholderia pseudomultivorans]
MTGHVAEIAGHDPETAGHVRPKYARVVVDRLNPQPEAVIPRRDRTMTASEGRRAIRAKASGQNQVPNGNDTIHQGIAAGNEANF